MAEWIYLIHPPRTNFAETMSEEEGAVWSVHWQRIQREFRAGRIILVGPTLGPTNTGICVFEADTEAEARAFMEADPIFASGFAELELRPFRVSLLRGRD